MGKDDFLMHEFFILSIGGTFQRGNVYKKENISEDEKKIFKRNKKKDF